MAETGKPWQGFPFTTIAEVAEEVFLSCVKCKLGNGKRLKFWRDRWLDRKGVEQLAPSLMAFVRSAGGEAEGLVLRSQTGAGEQCCLEHTRIRWWENEKGGSPWMPQK
jgi:hypothetical protein